MKTALALLAVMPGCSSKPETKKIDELGIEITVPGTWDRKQRGGGDIALAASGFEGVILHAEPRPIKTIEEARGRLIQSHRIREEKTLPSGVFLFDYDVDYGTPEKPMWMRHVEGILPTAKGYVSCTLQLQAGQDAEPIKQACGSMKPI